MDVKDFASIVSPIEIAFSFSIIRCSLTVVQFHYITVTSKFDDFLVSKFSTILYVDYYR